MAASCILSAAWNFATYGTSTVAVVDTIGGGTISYSTGYREHGITGGSNISTLAGVATPALTAFGSALSTSLNALGGDSYVVTFSVTTGKYTISTQIGNFSLTFTGAAGTLMRKLLGFSGDKSGAQTYTSDYVPWFVLVPAVAGLTNDSGVTRKSGASKSAMSATGTRYVMQPTSIPRVRTWEHHFEPKERVDLDYINGGATSTHLYCWEQLWSDYGTAILPIGVRVEHANGRVEQFAFALETPEYDRSVLQRMRPNDDVRFKVHVEATLWPGATAGTYARVIS